MTVISMTGYTKIVLALNMLPFVAQDDPVTSEENLYTFNRLRGTELFAQFLRKTWKQRVEAHYDPRFMFAGRPVGPEQVGFATGIFRQSMLERHAVPTYHVNLEQVLFNMPSFEWISIQPSYRKLCDHVVGFWDTAIRPTTNGLFTVTFTRHYENSDENNSHKPAQDILDVVKYVVHMQTCFRLDDLKAEDPLLRWLHQNQRGFSEADKDFVLQVMPVQWQLATTVCREFMRFVCREELETDSPVEFGEGFRVKFDPDAVISPPAHDSYVVHHIDRLFVKPDWASKPEEYHEFYPRDLHEDQQSNLEAEKAQWLPQVKRGIFMLLEGSILRNHESPEVADTDAMPTHDPKRFEEIIQQDLSTWEDEICILKARSALVWPSRDDLDTQLLAPLLLFDDIRYRQYWDAIERMIEFLVEIQLLAQLLDRLSMQVLGQFVNELERVRLDMPKLNLPLDQPDVVNRLMILARRAANIGRLVGICQGLARPSRWCRAEYAIVKADHLVKQMKIDELLQNATYNSAALAELVSHTDDLYIAEVGEEANKRQGRISLFLSVVSLPLALIALPSFLTDLDSVRSGSDSASFALTLLSGLAGAARSIGLSLDMDALQWIATTVLLVTITVAFYTFVRYGPAELKEELRVGSRVAKRMRKRLLRWLRWAWRSSGGQPRMQRRR